MSNDFLCLSDAMFCIAFWSSLPSRKDGKDGKDGKPDKDDASIIKVYTKLGGKFLGLVDKSKFPHGASCYAVICYLQDQIAGFFKHACRPAKYIVLYVGSTRLTKPSFMFDNQVDESTSSLLLETSRLDVMYEEDDLYALKELRRKGFKHDDRHEGRFTFHVHYEEHDVLLQPEMQVLGFRNITSLKLRYACKDLGEADCFSYLQDLELEDPFSLYNDSSGLAGLVNLTRLHLSLDFPGNSMEDVVKLTKLQHLTLKYHTSRRPPTTSVHLPPTLGKLTNLKELRLVGAAIRGTIPTELGQLNLLEHLGLTYTCLTSTIPSELGKLSSLRTLDLYSSGILSGELPKELNNTNLLKIDLRFTRVAYFGVMNRGTWHQYTTLTCVDAIWTLDKCSGHMLEPSRA